MYKKSAVILVLFNMMIVVVCLNIKGIAINRYASLEAYKIQLCGEEQEIKRTSFLGLLTGVTSEQRVLEVNVMEKKSRIEITKEDYNNLSKIVEAEAGGEDRTGKLLVANVVINRVLNDKFPNSVTEVIYQKNMGVAQFSPTCDGRMNKIKVSEETIEAVDSALAGEDVSRGALYFVARKSADPNKLKWFDLHLTKLFTYGGHDFFA